MKKNYLHCIFPILCFLIFISFKGNAQCNSTDWNALKALYNSTNGQFWINKANWNQVTSASPPANCNLEILYGITLNGNGRVAQINLENNLLNGTLPSQIHNLSNLFKLNLADNSISGPIPTDFDGQMFLQELNLKGNNFSGNIPMEYTSLTNLTILDLSQNNLTGNILPELSNLTNLTKLDLAANNLNGNIPDELCFLTNLTELSLNSNEIEGEIPPALCSLNNLVTLNLTNNQIEGDIPIEIENLDDLEYLLLSNNQIENFPVQIANLNNIKNISASGNDIEDDIPEEVFEIVSLETLNLYDNRFHGGIPIEAVAKRGTNLTRLTVRDNQLTWVCPPEGLGALCDKLLNNPDDIDRGNYFTNTYHDFCEGYICEIDDPDNNGNLSVWPGDTNLDGEVTAQDYIPIVEKLFYLQTGPARATSHKNNNWYGHPVTEWGIKNEYGLDIAHYDCNGDGIINDADQQAVSINLNNQHSERWIESPEVNFQSEWYTEVGGTNLIMDLVEMGNTTNTNTRLGIHLTNADGTNVRKVVSGYLYIYVDALISNASVNLTPNGSWLGNNLQVFYNTSSNENIIEVAFIKTDGIASSGSGYIGYIDFQFSSNNAQKTASNNSCFRTFSTQHMRMNDDFSNSIPISNTELTISGGCSNGNKVVYPSSNYECYNYKGTVSTSGNVIVNANEQTEFRATRVRLNNGFKVKAGAQFRAVYGCL